MFVLDKTLYIEVFDNDLHSKYVNESKNQLKCTLFMTFVHDPGSILSLYLSQ